MHTTLMKAILFIYFFSLLPLWSIETERKFFVTDIPYITRGRTVVFDANQIELGIVIGQNSNYLTILTKASFLVDLSYDGMIYVRDFTEMWLFPKADCKGQAHVHHSAKEATYPKRLIKHYNSEKFYIPELKDHYLVVQRKRFVSSTSNKYCENSPEPTKGADAGPMRWPAIVVVPVDWNKVSLPEIIKPPLSYRSGQP